MPMNSQDFLLGNQVVKLKYQQTDGTFETPEFIKLLIHVQIINWWQLNDKLMVCGNEIIFINEN